MRRFICAIRTLGVLRTAVGVVLLIWFVSTLILVQPAKPTTPPALPTSTFQGVWQVVGVPEQAGTGPFSQDWFALLPMESKQARVSWAREGWCSQVEGRIIDGEVHVFDHNTRIIVAVQANATATATVYQGNQRWTQHYVKRSATIPACDWLLE